jgi:hypothetical protein
MHLLLGRPRGVLHPGEEQPLNRKDRKGSAKLAKKGNAAFLCDLRVLALRP